MCMICNALYCVQIVLRARCVMWDCVCVADLVSWSRSGQRHIPALLPSGVVLSEGEERLKSQFYTPLQLLLMGSLEPIIFTEEESRCSDPTESNLSLSLSLSILPPFSLSFFFSSDTPFLSKQNTSLIISCILFLASVICCCVGDCRSVNQPPPPPPPSSSLTHSLAHTHSHSVPHLLSHSLSLSLALSLTAVSHVGLA